MPADTTPRSSPWPAFACVALGVFMATLDSSIVNVALPSILDDFGASLATVEWVVNVYLLVITGLLLAFGRLADMWGHRRVFLGGLAAFTGGSALCAAAGSTAQLIGARGIQGIGGAMIMACSPAVITAVFPANQRGRGLGLVGTTVALGLTSGPPLGGFLLEWGGWRSVFLVNVPVGLLALGLTARVLPGLRFSRGHQRFDSPGAALFTTGCAALLLVLNRAADWGVLAWPSLLTGSCGAGCLAGFLLREARVEDPLLDLRLFARPSFSAAVCAALLSFLAAFVAILLLPFYLAQVRGLGARDMGLVLTVTPLVMSLLAPWAGALSDRVGYGRLTTAGLSVRAFSFLLLFLVGPETPMPWVLAALVLLGAGGAIFNPPNTSSIMGSVPPDRLGVAGGTAAVARNLGMALGVAIGGATFSAAFRSAGGSSLATLQPADIGAFTAGWRAAMAVGLGCCLAAVAVSGVRSLRPAAEAEP